MIEFVDWKAAGFFFAVFSFIFGGIARVLWDMIKRQIKGIDDRLTQIEEDIDEGRQSRENIAKQMGVLSVGQARMEERLNSIPSHTQFANLAGEVGQIKSGQLAMGKQLGIVIEHLIGKDGEGKK